MAAVEVSEAAATQKKSLHHSTNQTPKNICHLNNSAVSKQISIAERTVAKVAKPPSGISMGAALNTMKMITLSIEQKLYQSTTCPATNDERRGTTSPFSIFLFSRKSSRRHQVVAVYDHGPARLVEEERILGIEVRRREQIPRHRISARPSLPPRPVVSVVPRYLPRNAILPRQPERDLPYVLRAIEDGRRGLSIGIVVLPRRRSNRRRRDEFRFPGVAKQLYPIGIPRPIGYKVDRYPVRVLPRIVHDVPHRLVS